MILYDLAVQLLLVAAYALVSVGVSVVGVKLWLDWRDRHGR